jgi:inner membrane transporter RhtA
MTIRSLNATRGLAVAATLGSILSLCVGSSYAKSLFPSLGAEGTTVVRLAFGAGLLLLLWRPWRWPLSARDAGNIAIYGLVLGAMNLLFYLAIARIPLGLAIAIEFTGPLVLAIASSRQAADYLWIGFAVLGLGLLLPILPNASTLDPLGIAFALGAALCWALYIITGQRVAHVRSGQATSLGMLVAVLLVLPFGAAPAVAVWRDPGLLLTGLVVGIMSSAVPYSLEMVALRHLPKQSFGILLSMEPAVGAVIAMVILGEALTPLQWMAIACIVVASIGSTMRSAPQPVANPQNPGIEAR